MFRGVATCLGMCYWRHWRRESIQLASQAAGPAPTERGGARCCSENNFRRPSSLVSWTDVKRNVGTSWNKDRETWSAWLVRTNCASFFLSSNFATTSWQLLAHLFVPSQEQKLLSSSSLCSPLCKFPAEICWVDSLPNHPLCLCHTYYSRTVCMLLLK